MSGLLKFKRKQSKSERFEAFVRPHFDALYHSALRFTANRSDAEDLVQEACLKAYESFPEDEEIVHSRAWLLRIVYHAFIDEYRRKSRVTRQLGTSVDQYDMNELEDRNGIRPDEQVDTLLKTERVLAAMSYLDKEQCALLAMHDVDGMSIEELSRITNLPEGTVKSRLYRTREKIGRLLKNSEVSRARLRVVGGRQ